MTHRPLPLALLTTLRRQAAAGFTLTELLITVTIGLWLAGGAAISLIASMRAASNLELGQRAVDDFGRLNLFLQSEISEAERIEYNTSTLPDSCGEGKPLFTLVLPNPLNPPEPPADRIREPMPRIYYYSRNGGADLWRCGPSFDAEGALMVLDDRGGLADISPARVNADTRLSLLNTDDDRTLVYSVQFRSRKGTVTLQRGSATIPLVARTGVRMIE